MPEVDMNNKLFKILQKSSPQLAYQVSQDEKAMEYIRILDEEQSRILLKGCVKELLTTFPFLKVEEL